VIDASCARHEARRAVDLNTGTDKKLILAGVFSLTESIQTNIVTIPRRTLDVPASGEGRGQQECCARARVAMRDA
jgi:hypothetical protein